MPELPGAESARAVLERSALARRIVAVDDTDAHVCRPHPPGEIVSALTGRHLVAAHRRGKRLWCETNGGPVLGLHLGMSGKIVTAAADSTEVDGGMLHLIDPRRLGRVRLDPRLDDLGPDAATLTATEFTAAVRERSRTGQGPPPRSARPRRRGQPARRRDPVAGRHRPSRPRSRKRCAPAESTPCL